MTKGQMNDSAFFKKGKNTLVKLQITLPLKGRNTQSLRGNITQPSLLYLVILSTY